MNREKIYDKRKKIKNGGDIIKKREREGKLIDKKYMINKRK